VLIFERIREELRNGKTPAAAVDQGFAKAWVTIIDTHVTTIVSAFILFLGFCLYKWFQDDVYGVNKHSSLYFMGGMYLLAIAIYFGSKLYRRSQGMDLNMVYGEIPAE